MDDFFSQTGCVVLLPPGQEDEQVTLLGPAARLAEAEAKALELAMQWQLSNIVLSRHNPMHVMNVTRYLRQRAEIERLEAAYQTRINTPFSEAGTNLWELYSRDPKTATMARTEINGVFNGHPPQRILTMNVDDFFYPHLRNGVSKQLRQDYGVQIVVPTAADGGAPVLLVYEGPDTAESPYTIPKTQPSSEEIKIFQQGLRDAERRILQLIEKQGEIIKTSIDVPEK